ncbi:helix-turn-helix domain-containing protein [Coxiella burnetii]|uniref:helix-turn-helix domain-containing protein n=1 Tax=Coxiella burnetii TaxID=777 RepID=UPI001EDD79EB|nr:helix-turn-helix transcriptional regulator [Coxiella burnetii]UYK69402.1 helix-turn-helix domain-containing protein [Coxiella burnetii]
MTRRSTTWHKTFKQTGLSDPEAKAEYEAFKLQLELADQLKKERQKAHLTQETVAERVETQKPVVARIEAAGGKGRHSPSLKTLVKYANAIGCHLQIKLVSSKKRKGAR